MHSNTSVVLAGGSLELPHLQHVREIYAGAGPALLWPLWRRRLLARRRSRLRLGRGGGAVR